LYIFLFGARGSGKTPFADMVSKELGINIISVSQWLKPLTEELVFAHKQQQIDTVTNININELIKDPNGFVNYVKSFEDTPAIIDGICNIYDFSRLFDIRRDLIVFLNRNENPYKTNLFETGLLQIDSYLNWSAALGLIDKERRINYKFDMKDLREVADDFVKLFTWRGWCLQCGGAGCSHQKSKPLDPSLQA